jgi:hypothetical protein
VRNFQRHTPSRVEDTQRSRLFSLVNMLLFELMADVTGSVLMSFIVKFSLGS